MSDPPTPPPARELIDPPGCIAWLFGIPVEPDPELDGMMRRHSRRPRPEPEAEAEPERENRVTPMGIAILLATLTLPFSVAYGIGEGDWTQLIGMSAIIGMLLWSDSEAVRAEVQGAHPMRVGLCVLAWWCFSCGFFSLIGGHHVWASPQTELAPSQPEGLAVDRRGRIYVASMWLKRVQRYDRDGRFELGVQIDIGRMDYRLRIDEQDRLRLEHETYKVDGRSRHVAYETFDEDGQMISRSFGPALKRWCTEPGIEEAEADGARYLVDNGKAFDIAVFRSNPDGTRDRVVLSGGWRHVWLSQGGCFLMVLVAFGCVGLSCIWYRGDE